MDKQYLLWLCPNESNKDNEKNIKSFLKNFRLDISGLQTILKLVKISWDVNCPDKQV